MIICEHCGHRNYLKTFVKVPLCAECGKELAPNNHKHVRCVEPEYDEPDDGEYDESYVRDMKKFK